MILDPDFYQWWTDAEANRLGQRALCEYYRRTDPDALFTARINGNQHTFPILTTPRWMTLLDDPDDALNAYVDDTYSRRDDRTVQLRTNFLGFLNNDPNPDPARYVWNGEVAFSAVAPDETAGTPVKSDYYTKLALEGKLLDELFRALYHTNITPESPTEELRNLVPHLALETRDEYAHTLSDILATPVSTGSTMLVLFNTGDDYCALFAKRSFNVVESPGLWSLAPSGVLQFDDWETPSVLKHHLREYSEELFANDPDTGPLQEPQITALQEALDAGTAHIDHLGLTVEGRRASLDYNALLVVDDVEYYKTYIESGITLSPEHDEYELVPVTDGARLEELITEMKPYHAYCAIRGLQHAADEYDIDVGVDLAIENPQP